MNKEVISRTSSDTFDNLEEKIYKVDSTGASISTGCSISLLHRYCAKLPRDMYGFALLCLFFKLMFQTETCHSFL